VWLGLLKHVCDKKVLAGTLQQQMGMLASAWQHLAGQVQ
jgi:hypothetical protein